MDVKSAYLNASLESFEGKNENYVWKLLKAWNGLKQSSRTCNKTFHTYLNIQNFEQSPVDPCMYVQNINQISFILLWVDDILIASKTEAD